MNVSYLLEKDLSSRGKERPLYLSPLYGVLNIAVSYQGFPKMVHGVLQWGLPCTILPSIYFLVLVVLYYTGMLFVLPHERC